MKIVCECCGNDDLTMFFDTPEVTMCMICGEVDVEHTEESQDVLQPVFID